MRVPQDAARIHNQHLFSHSDTRRCCRQAVWCATPQIFNWVFSVELLIVHWHFVLYIVLVGWHNSKAVCVAFLLPLCCRGLKNKCCRGLKDKILKFFKGVESMISVRKKNIQMQTESHVAFYPIYYVCQRLRPQFHIYKPHRLKPPNFPVLTAIIERKFKVCFRKPTISSEQLSHKVHMRDSSFCRPNLHRSSLLAAQLGSQCSAMWLATRHRLTRTTKRS